MCQRESAQNRDIKQLSYRQKATMSKKEMYMLQEASKKLWVIQMALETETEAINHKERNKKEASGTASLMRARRKTPCNSQ